LLAAFAVLAVSGTVSGSTGGRAFTIADYYRTAFVGAPAVSPDGSTVAFAVTRYDLGAGESWREIWTMAADGDDLRQMTVGRHHDGDPIFSHDGDAVLFVSDRGSSAPQLWRLPVDGGEARQLTDIHTGVADPVVSPDGRWIAVTSEVYPECGADMECNETILTSTAGGPLRVRVADELLYRHWTAWREGRYRHVLLLDATTGDVVRDLTPGRWDSPVFSVGGGGVAFAPDGGHVVVTANHEPDPARSTNADLWLIDVEPGPAGHRARNLTQANRGWDGDPVFSPDGRHVAYRSQVTPGFEADLFRLAVVEIASGRVRYLTDRDSFDDWVTAVRWLPDGSGLVFQAERQGEQPLFTVDLARGRITRRLADGAMVGWALGPGGDSVVYTRSRVSAPPEVFTASFADGSGRRLTRFNEQLETEVDIRSAESLWVPTADGRRIHVFVVKPHDFDPEKTYPLILNVHGGPQMQWTDRYRGDWQVYPGAGYVVAFPNPTGSTGYGQDVVDAISCDWGGRVFDDLMTVTDSLAGLSWVDADRMGAMGWSWGGYMMMWFEGHTQRFAALASMMGVYDLRSMWGATEELWFVEKDMCGTPWTSDVYERFSPSRHAAGFATPCLVITGENDYRVPYTQSLHFFTDLQVQDVPSRLVVFPEAGHWPSWYEMAFYYLAHLDWFHQWLGGDGPPWDLLQFSRNQTGIATTSGDDEPVE
jgi:dipeptidyl aminopeptidase/acylaminoacyl peptidase